MESGKRLSFLDATKLNRHERRALAKQNKIKQIPSIKNLKEWSKNKQNENK